MNISNLIQKIRNHVLLISLLIYFIYTIYLLILLEGLIILVYGTAFFSILAIPSFFIGMLITKYDSPIVGLSYGLSYLSVGIASELITKTPFLFFYSLEVLLIVFPIGVLFTWIGSVFGDFIRDKLGKGNLNLNIKKGFVFGYIIYLIWYMRF